MSYNNQQDFLNGQIDAGDNNSDKSSAFEKDKRREAFDMGRQGKLTNSESLVKTKAGLLTKVEVSQDPKLKGVLDPLTRVVEEEGGNQLLALAVGASISAIVVQSVNGLTQELFSWASKTYVLGPLYHQLQLSVFGATINVPHMIGILVYIIVSLSILVLVVFGILAPLIRRSDQQHHKNDKKDGNA